MYYQCNLTWSWGGSFGQRFNETSKFTVNNKIEILEQLKVIVKRISENYAFDCSRITHPLYPILHGLIIRPVDVEETVDATHWQPLLDEAVVDRRHMLTLTKTEV